MKRGMPLFICGFCKYYASVDYEAKDLGICKLHTINGIENQSVPPEVTDVLREPNCSTPSRYAKFVNYHDYSCEDFVESSRRGIVHCTFCGNPVFITHGMFTVEIRINQLDPYNRLHVEKRKGAILCPACRLQIDKFMMDHNWLYRYNDK